jgi:hypothetical protein
MDGVDLHNTLGLVDPGDEAVGAPAGGGVAVERFVPWAGHRTPTRRKATASPAWAQVAIGRRVIGIDDVRQDVAMLRTPDGHGRIELAMFHTPEAISAEPKDAPVNEDSYRLCLTPASSPASSLPIMACCGRWYPPPRPIPCGGSTMYVAPRPIRTARSRL